MPLPRIPRALTGSGPAESAARPDPGAATATARIVEADPAQWMRRVVANPDGGHVFQGPVFADHQAQRGWDPVQVMVDLDGRPIAVTVLRRSVPGLGAVWYAPKGPGTTTLPDTVRVTLALGELAREHGAFLLKIEPELEDSPEVREGLEQAGLEESAGVRPTGSTVVLDLSAGPERIEAALPQTVRATVEAARRAGVSEVVPVDDASCEIFLKVLERSGDPRPHPRDRDYDLSLWKRHAAAGQGCFVFGYALDPDDPEAPRTVVCCDFVMLMGARGWRADAACLPSPPVPGLPVLNVLEAARWLGARGVGHYDLCWTPGSPQDRDDAPPQGDIRRLAAGIHREATDLVGSWRLPLDPVRYRAWTGVLEDTVLRLHQRRTGRSWY